MSILDKLKQAVNATYHGVTPFDNGQGWTSSPVPKAPPALTPAPGQSIISRLTRDVTHNPVTNVVGQRVFKPVAHFATPAVHMVGGLSSGGYHVAALPIETLRTATAEVTGNQAATQAGIERASKGGEFIKNLVQGIPRMAYQLGESVNPSGGDVYKREHTFQSPVAKAIFGDQPVASMQKQYKESKQAHGKGYAAGEATLTAISDALLGKQGAEATIKAAPKVAETVQSISPSEIASNHPIVQALNDHLNQLNTSRDNLVARGVSENHPALRANARAYTDTLAAKNEAVQQIAQGGYAKLPGKGPAPDLSAADAQTIIEGLNKEAVKRPLAPDEITLQNHAQAILDKKLTPPKGSVGTPTQSDVLKAYDATEQTLKSIKDPAMRAKLEDQLKVSAGKDLQNTPQIKNLPKVPDSTYYHGTNADAATSILKNGFKPNERGQLNWFTKNPKHAGKFAQVAGGDSVIQANIELKNPLVVGDKPPAIIANELNQGLNYSNPEVVAKLKAAGYDGVKVTQNGVENVLPFDNASIKVNAPGAGTPKAVRPAEVAPKLPSRPKSASVQDSVSSGISKALRGEKVKPKDLTPEEVKMADALGLSPKKAAAATNEMINPPTRGFNKSIMRSTEVSENVKDVLPTSTYTPKANAELLKNTDALLARGLDKATEKVFRDLSQSAGRVTDQHISDAIGVAKRLDAEGKYGQSSLVYDQLSNHLTAAGRKVQAASLLGNRTPEGLMYSALKTFKKAGVEVDANLHSQLIAAVDEVRAAAANSPARDIATQKLVQLVNKNLPRSKAEAITSIWRAGLLTGPETAAKVAVSHAITAPIELASRPVSALIDRLTSLATGKRTTTLSPAEDITTFLKGQARGVKAGIEKTKTGIDMPNTGGFEQSMGMHGGQSLYEELPYRLHGSIFKPNYSGAFDLKLIDEARTEAVNQGITGAERQSFIQDFLKKPPKDSVQRATDYAENFTNMQRTELGKVASSIQRIKIGNFPIGNWLVAFTRIPTAIAQKGLVDWTPIGLSRDIIRAVNQIREGKFDQAQFSQSVGRSLTGSVGTTVVGYELMHNDRMTLKAPGDPKERALWDAEGKKANSIYVGGTVTKDAGGVPHYSGGKWVSLNAFGPAGISIGLGGAFSDSEKQGGNIFENMATATAAAGKLISDQPYFKGIAGAANALNDSQRYAKAFMENTIGSFVPALVQQTARGTDPNQRYYPNNLKDTLLATTPGLRETLPKQTDIFGTNMPGPGGTPQKDVVGAFNPFYSSNARNTNDKPTTELQRLYSTLGSPDSPSFAPPNTVTLFGNTIKPTSAQKQAMAEGAGPIIHQGIENLLNNPAYQNLSDQEKSDEINVVIRQARDIWMYQNADTVFNASSLPQNGKQKGLTQAEKLALSDPSQLGMKLSSQQGDIGPIKPQKASTVPKAKGTTTKKTTTKKTTSTKKASSGRTAKTKFVLPGFPKASTNYAALSRLLNNAKVTRRG